MFILYLFITLLIIINGQEQGYCTKEKSCDEISEDKYLFYEVNPPEGFNLRRDVYMRFAIMFAKNKLSETRRDWSLVLPPWYKLYHWKSESPHAKPMPWGSFFEIDELQKFAPVLELHQIFSETTSKVLRLDRVYVLQNYENAFENGDFRDKWEINKCNYNPDFWGYKNITANEILCVKYQGQISKIWEIINLHPTDKKIMFFHGEIPLHDEYGTKMYWDCRKSMKFNKKLVKTAKNFINKHFNSTNLSYIAVHWRRQDFARSRKKDIPSIQGTAKQINNAIKTHKLNTNKVFVASDASHIELNQLEKDLKSLGYSIYLYIPTASFSDGEIAIIEQIICSHATYFIGTHESTFTFRIQEEREILGFDSSTTFNRLCPDSGYCEKPSKWTIVH